MTARHASLRTAVFCFALLTLAIAVAALTPYPLLGIVLAAPVPAIIGFTLWRAQKGDSDPT